MSNKFLLYGCLFMASFAVLGDVLGFYDLPALPNWFFFFLGIGFTLIIQNKFLYKPMLNETALAQQELQLIRADDSLLEKRVHFSGVNNVPFTADEFRRWMKIITEFMIEYYEHPEVYDVTTSGVPGFIYEQMPIHAPNKPEPFENVLHDLYKIILPGLTHWHHPRFHAYFYSGMSYPDIVAEALSSALGTVNFCWDASPAFTELEIVMVNWVGRVFGLPEEFLFQGKSEASVGGGAMQDSASDAILLAILAARHKKITQECGKVVLECRDKEHQTLSKLVAYASIEAHSCSEKAALIALVHMRPVKPDENFSMRGAALEKQILKDIDRGLVPFFVHVTLGTTGTGSYDNLKEIVEVASRHNMWVHIDGAYGGNAWVCPEFRYQMEGIERADSININMHKIMFHSTPGTYFWTRNQRSVKESMTVDPTYLKARHEGATDFRHWGTQLSRRSRCLKTWFIFRTYGISGMQEYIRRLVRLADRMHKNLREDSRIEIVGEPVFQLVAFRIKHPIFDESNKLTTAFASYINNSHKMVVTHATCNGINVVRISIGHHRSLEKEIDESYQILSDLLEDFLVLSNHPTPRRIPFAADVGIIGSPALSTQSTCSTRSMTSLFPSGTQSSDRNVSPGNQSPASAATSGFDIRRDPKNLQNYPDLKSEKTPHTGNDVSNQHNSDRSTSIRRRRRRRASNPKLN